MHDGGPVERADQEGDDLEMDDQRMHGPPFEPIVQIRSPRVYGSFPTLFGAPLAETEQDLKDADIALLGVPWCSPTTPGSFGSPSIGTLMSVPKRGSCIDWHGFIGDPDLRQRFLVEHFLGETIY
jgi:hypothetical protein